MKPPAAWTEPARLDLSPGERAVFRRPPDLPGVETLTARYVTHSFLPHAHEGVAVAVLLNGAERYRYRGGEQTVGAGEVAIVAPGEVHTGSALDAGGWAYRVAYVHPDWLGGAAGFREAVVRDPVLAGAWQAAHAALASAEASALAREALVREAVEVLLVRWGDAAPAHQAAVDHAGVREVQAFLDAHPDTTLNLSALAGRVGLSASHLSRSFRSVVGVPPHAYLLGVRAQAARPLLLRGIPIGEAALAVGFADQAHLTRVFTRVFGVTPGAFVRGAGSFKTAGRAVR
ncbi:helix-turn-helix transcriptional regulator [Deinococcus radiotolerans]|uniref:Transcriptional regulator n=1 Tax=Deinococcus radiotolerans TaxID=1309407 RepID=A0ABQ2FKZ4_9DEIO|nr:AraC family transcriptional regulator [Deinococcus radiotolerans]GGL06414.1 transcriptional regulator [Deinococcus radiotolerans]